MRVIDLLRPVLAACLLAGPLAAATATIAVPALPANARLALCGDSITEQMLYTTYVEAYILACAGRGDVSVFQFGWGGENADQFSNRIRRGDLDAFVPTAVAFAYGANDGGNMAWQDWMETMWRGRIGSVLSSIRAKYPAAATCTVICSPTWLQASPDGSNAAGVATYNATLGRFRDLDLELARTNATGFADVRQRMNESSAAALAAIGPGYRFGGSDGVHAGPNGHLMIAYELLRALNFQGGIATISVDMAGGATASPGHAVVSASGGRIGLSSTRYPFCYNYDNSTAGDRLATILPHLPFSQDLNRFTLVVRNLGAASANVTWGSETRNFTAAELGAGVNLAAAFAHTPFDAAFANLVGRISAKQVQERTMIKRAGDATAPTKGWTPADVAARDALDAAVHAAVTAVSHTITIVPSGGGPAAPVVTSSAAGGTVGTPFSYQISAVNAPSGYTASNLPEGLSVDADSGLISGTPTQAVSGRAVGLTASNAAGSGSGTLTLTIAPAVAVPVVGSAQAASATVGHAFAYRITASGNPTKFYATGLPPGLSVNAQTGEISGTPQAAGVCNVLISAENAGGNGPAVTLVLTITAAGGGSSAVPHEGPGQASTSDGACGSGGLAGLLLSLSIGACGAVRPPRAG